jgi:uncharacterized protein (TIGR04255 family)
MSQPFPKFERPPVVETVLGVQFDTLKITTAQLGLFWKSLGADWPTVAEAAPLPEQRERFGELAWATPEVQINVHTVVALAPLRLQISNRAGDRMIQVQKNRFHYNWQKKGGTYPSYKKVRAEFDQALEAFRRFIAAEGLGDIAPNQWELTYVDYEPPGELWRSPAEWGNVLPGLLCRDNRPEGLRLETLGGEWHYEIMPQRGRLHVTLNLGKVGEAAEGGLLLQTTARGPVGGDSGLGIGSGLDLGHEAIVRMFLEITSAEAHRAWGRRD